MLTETTNIYDDMGTRPDIYHQSEIGLFKDETKGIPIIEFVGLRPKLYSYKTQTYESCKGVNTSMRDCSFELYKDILLNQSNYYCTQSVTRSKNHSVEIVEQKKLALSALDTKMYIMDDGINMLPYGWANISSGGSWQSSGTTNSCSL